MIVNRRLSKIITKFQISGVFHSHGIEWWDSVSKLPPGSFQIKQLVRDPEQANCHLLRLLLRPCNVGPNRSSSFSLRPESIPVRAHQQHTEINEYLPCKSAHSRSYTAISSPRLVDLYVLMVDPGGVEPPCSASIIKLYSNDILLIYY